MAVNNILNLKDAGLTSFDGAGTFAGRTLTPPAAGITITNGNGVSGNPTLALSDDLAAIESLSTTGLATRTGTSTWTTRTLTQGTGITITNGDGVSGNPTISATASVPTTFTEDSGSATPSANNLNLLGSGSITTTGSGATVTTALTGLTNHALLVGAGTSTITKVGPTATAGQVLQSAGSSADPAFSTATYPSTATGTGTILRANGTNFVATTATYPTTTTINQILYSSSSNVIGEITAANNGTLISGATGIPSWLANGTTGQVLTATTGSPPSWQPVPAGGTVTDVSVVSANGFAGSVATSTTTPAITLSTTVTGVLSGNGTAISGSAITNHNVLVAGTSNAITSVAPSATSGIPLVSNGSSADPSFTTAVVAGGGTGNTTFTAYSVIAAGTTATGAFQNVSGVGTSGQVLTSNGAGALPTWQTSSAGAGILSASATLTNSQVKNLHGTPVQAIAAPGAGNVIQIIQASTTMNYGGTNAFTAGASQTISLYYGTAVSSGTLMSNSALTSASSSYNALVFPGQGAGTYNSLVNTAMNIYNPIATEISGNAANNNTVSYNIVYRIITIP